MICPKVSIIIPAFNVQSYLEECVNSVLNQTYHNLEIILVDDGSTDKTAELCDILHSQDNRVFTVHTPNRGVSAARNTGLDVVTGDYILFVDSDDYIDEELIEYLVQTIISSNSQIVQFNYSFVSQFGEPLQKSPKMFMSTKHLSQSEWWKMFFEYTGCYSPVWSKIYSKEVFDDLRFYEGKIYEDSFILHKIISKCSTIFCVPYMGYYRRNISSSIMHSRYTINSLDCIEAYIERTKFFLIAYSYDLASECFVNATKCFYTFFYPLFLRNAHSRTRYQELLCSLRQIYASHFKNTPIHCLKYNLFFYLHPCFMLLSSFFSVMKRGK